MPAPYGEGLYANEPPRGYGLNITDLFHIVEPKPEDPGINSKVDSQYPNVAIIAFDTTNQFGGMWAKEQLDLTMSFSTEMYLHLGHQYGKSGNVADGITFTLHNDPAGLNAIGGAGEGLGVYKGRKWTGEYWQGNPVTAAHGTYLRNSLVIEFDTYRNLISQGAFVDDPAGTAHCSLLVPRANSISAQNHGNTFTFTPSQEWIRFEANWTPNSSGGGVLSYTFNGVQKTYTVNNIISTFGGTKVYWGFTGATGQLTSVLAAAITRLPLQGVIAEKTVKNADGEDIDHGHALPGDILSYTIRVTAQSLSRPIGPILIDDEIPEFVEYTETYVSVRTSTGDVFNATSSYSANIMSVNTTRSLYAAGDWIEITFSVTVKEDAVGRTVYNWAVVNAEGLSESQETNITDVTIFSEPEKKVSDNSAAGRGGSAVKVGDQITYEIVYGNDHDTPADIMITDKLPDGVDFVSFAPGSAMGVYDEITHSVTWDLKAVPRGAGAVSVIVGVNESALVKIDNSATVQVGENEPYITNIVTNPVIPEEPEKKVSANSEAGQNGSAIKAGDKITYEISYLNYEEEAAIIIITDRLPLGVDFDSATNNGKYDEDTHTVTWTLTDVASGTRDTVSVVVIVNKQAALRIGNYATVQVGNNDPRFTNLVLNPIKGSHCANIKQAAECREIIKGSLVWEDNDNINNTRPPSIEITLLRDGEVYQSVSIASSDVGIFTFGCLPIWKNSKHKYNYQVDELTIPDGYTKTIDGYLIINTLSKFSIQ